MPTLQNNNPNPVGSGRGQLAPKNQSYVDEVKQVNLYPQNNYGGIIAQGTQQMLHIATEYEKKSQEIETVNKINDYGAELQRENNSFKMEYAKNPGDQNLVRNHQSRINDLRAGYERQVPGFFRNYFQQSVQQLDQQQNTELWQKQVDLEFQSRKFTGGLDKDLVNFKNAGFGGTPIDGLLQNFSFKREQSIKLFGEQASEKLMEEYQRKAATSYLDGMLTTNPGGALQLLESGQFDSLLDDRTRIHSLKLTAQKRQEAMELWKEEQNTAQALSQLFPLFEELEAGNMSYSDLRAAAAEIGLDGETTDYFLRKANYGGTRPAGSPAPKLSEEGKQKIQHDLHNRLFAIYTDENPGLVEVRELQRDVLRANAQKALGDVETETLLARLGPKLNSVLTSRTRQEYDDRSSWNIFGFGKTKLEKTIEGFLQNAGLANDPENMARADRKLYYEMTNRFHSLYLDKLDEEAKKYSDQNLKQIFVNSYDTLRLMSDEDRRRTENLALDNTIRTFALEEGLDVRNKTLGEVNREVNLKILKENRDNIGKAIDNLLKKRKTQNPFALDLKMSPMDSNLTKI
jgi:hypothetical protein